MMRGAERTWHFLFNVTFPVEWIYTSANVTSRSWASPHCVPSTFSLNDTQICGYGSCKHKYRTSSLSVLSFSQVKIIRGKLWKFSSWVIFDGTSRVHNKVSLHSGESKCAPPDSYHCLDIRSHADGIFDFKCPRRIDLFVENVEDETLWKRCCKDSLYPTSYLRT